MSTRPHVRQPENIMPLDRTSSPPATNSEVPQLPKGATFRTVGGARRRMRQRPCENVRKRETILRGAREVFLTLGFDAASMDDIARAAGVSKGTLYLYFENKKLLFEAVCNAACEEQAETGLPFEMGCRDLRAELIRFGIDVVTFLCRPERVALLRTIIAAAGRRPEIGRSFSQAGPAPAIAILTAFLKRQVEAGVLAADDCELAAEQLIDACLSTLFKPMIFGLPTPPTQERVRDVVSAAVITFLAAHRRHEDGPATSCLES